MYFWNVWPHLEVFFVVQSLKGADAENIGYIIPTTVIHHFLSDYESNGRYTGKGGRYTFPEMYPKLIYM